MRAFLLALCAGCGATAVAIPTPTATLTATLTATATATATPTATATATPTATAPGPSALPALAGEQFVSLALDEHHSVLVSVPLGATARKPLVVATHGAGGKAESQCELWRRLMGDGAFVACPRGATSLGLPEEQRRYFYRDHLALAAEIDAVLGAVRARFGAYLDDAEPLYAGYSQGAGMGAMILPTHTGHFARALLVEGGFGEYHEWDIPTARRYAEHGGKRVAFVCGRAKCAELARESAAYLEKGGVAARVAFVDGAGHDWHGLEARIAAELGWLTAGDARWPALH